jgi:hypothetical protein
VAVLAGAARLARRGGPRTGRQRGAFDCAERRDGSWIGGGARELQGRRGKGELVVVGTGAICELI